MSITTFVGTPAQMQARIQELQMRLIAPGQWKCPSCGCHVSTTSIEPQACPACGKPMWMMTWKSLYHVEHEARIRLVRHYTGQEGLT